MSGAHKQTADFSSMAQTMRACSTWEPVSPLGTLDAQRTDDY
ncbi:hypothetical protein [Haloferax mediterranei]|nr:hypothetical protein [Haloferax mediterranei]